MAAAAEAARLAAIEAARLEAERRRLAELERQRLLGLAAAARAAEAAAAAEAARLAKEAAERMPPGWRVEIDEQGNPYFYHPKSECTTKDLAVGWTKHKSPDGHPYWYHKKSKTSWYRDPKTVMQKEFIPSFLAEQNKGKATGMDKGFTGNF